MQLLVIVLVLICSIQFILIIRLFSLHSKECSPSVVSFEPEINVYKSKDNSLEINKENELTRSIIPPPSLDGVAVTLFLHSPTWFQRRNTIMVRNVLDNLPRNWSAQIFYTAKGQSQNALDINPGLRRMIDRGEVILTLIPPEIAAVKKKYLEMWTEKWIWENVVAERVLVFGGNAVLCGNSPLTIHAFAEWDYLGAPWDNYKGQGGDGTISLRSKSAMISVINYELSKPSSKNNPASFKSWGQEDHFFVSRMLEMNRLKIAKFSVASREATLQFSAIGSAAHNGVFAASGTLPVLPFEERQTFLANVCPELKILFPSLHDPSCFGAKPNGTKCSKTICALQQPPKKGGC